MNREIEVLINEKYPYTHNRFGENVCKELDDRYRQAAKFGYELGAKEAVEFAEWTQLKNWNYSPTHKEWFKVHEEPQTTEQLLTEFTLFKSLNSKTDGDDNK